MILKVLSKKNMKEILELLYKHDELYFSQFLQKLGLNHNTISRVLNELIDLEMVSKREDDTGGHKLSKTYYKITEKGKKVIIFYELESVFEDLKPDQKIVYQIVSK
ncbi:MarR family transcriptional regulator [Methanococcus maripaludis]|uniref:DNA-binding HxlR family transcriptional regulator n=1 Tax=Methanococcus maripaludis TaxID=39152 RepID=A0A7J9SBX0_METMI|nr:MarR family transcriptional regulator [Methanococcus maripaludis]MBB6497563.1 DNA-binding HxlR family transcriptional regulator [Methanococcus maripaludis]